MKTMLFMTLCKKWDIILVPFPFTDLSETKKRPALIISPDKYNLGDDVVILFVTSHVTKVRNTGDYIIQHWKESGLPKPSLIKMKFATIDKNIIIKGLGTLHFIDRSPLEKIILEFFGTELETTKTF